MNDNKNNIVINSSEVVSLDLYGAKTVVEWLFHS